MAEESYKYLEIVPPFLHLANQVPEIPSELPCPAQFVRSRDPSTNLNFQVVALPDVVCVHDIGWNDEAEGVAPFLCSSDHDA